MFNRIFLTAYLPYLLTSQNFPRKKKFTRNFRLIWKIVLLTKLTNFLFKKFFFAVSRSVFAKASQNFHQFSGAVHNLVFDFGFSYVRERLIDLPKHEVRKFNQSHRSGLKYSIFRFGLHLLGYPLRPSLGYRCPPSVLPRRVT
jgi:hypothetical protein